MLNLDKINLDKIIEIVGQLEGSYKWYVIGAAVFLMAAIVNQIIFKTFKWIFILVGLVIIILALLWQFGYLRF